jgi:small subunit ribosomal protein S4
MGDPKRPRKTFDRPKSPWRSDQLAQELYLLGTYGLRNKRELWKAQTQLSAIRKQARHLLAASAELRLREEKTLLDSLKRKGLLGEGVSLDDVLSLSVEDLLSRRLQTIVFKQGLAISPQHARQLIDHKHIKIRDRIVNIPGYGVTRDEDGRIQLVAGPPQAPSPPAPMAATNKKKEEEVEQQPAGQEGAARPAQ